MDNARVMFDTGGATHVGKVRQRNEDSYLTRPDTGLWAVADGMGGHDDGDIASRTVVETLQTIEYPASAAHLLSLCEERIAEANSQLRAMSQERGGNIIGATIAVLLTYDGFYACIWSGDSRVYIVRGGQITQLSRDHTEVQDLLSEGVITAEEAKTWPGRNVITRAIGAFDQPELEMRSGPLEPGDSFIICSDGLTHHVQDQEIMQYASSYMSQQACDGLIALTLERGAVDNVTVVIVRYQPDAGSMTSPEVDPPRLEEWQK